MSGKNSFGFIGCGNMGGALAKAVCKGVDPLDVYLSNRSREKTEALRQSIIEESKALGKGEAAGGCCLKECPASEGSGMPFASEGPVISDNLSIAGKCKFIFLGVKPQGLSALLEEIRPVLMERADEFVLISMAAGTTIEKIKSFAGDFPVIRIMPNLPAAVGKGVVLYDSMGVSEDDLGAFLSAMKAAGELVPVEEGKIDAASAISGCGPAFVFMFIESLADGAVKCGIPRKTALKLAMATVSGSAEYAAASESHPEELKDAVCSPGGTTIEGVLALEAGAFRATVADAVVSAYEANKKF